MATVQDLVSFIEGNPPEGEIWLDYKWREALDNSVPGWQEIVRNPDNWPIIEKARPRRDFDDLLEVFLECAGVGLVNRWFKSSVREQAEVAGRWLRDLAVYVSERLSLELWFALSEEVRYDLVFRVFDHSPGEPFETWRRIADAIAHHAHLRHDAGGPLQIGGPLLPVVPYIPSREVRQLRRIVEAAGHRKLLDLTDGPLGLVDAVTGLAAVERKFLDLIDELIAERKKACQLAPVSTQRIPYTPSRDERELIARMMDKARQGGFRAAALPEMVLSFEMPPLFVAYPELEEADAEEEPGEQLVPRWRNRGGPETISIEEVLGCYVPSPQIRLYARGLRWFARSYGLDEDALRAVVLTHEVAHWVSHLLPKPGVPEWPLELYKQTEEEVHEGWAQLLTWWVVEDAGGRIKAVFEGLNRFQPQAYGVFERFKPKAVATVMASLERLRQLPWPARLEDWERFLS